jgi:hypothetical protein
MKRIAREPVTAEELNTSKRSFIDTFPRNFSTKAQIVGAFAQDEFTGRYAKDPNFYKTYRQRIDAVTIDDVQRVAKQYLNLSRLAILIVGKTDEILKGSPEHPVKLEDLGGGRVVRLPLHHDTADRLAPVGRIFARAGSLAGPRPSGLASTLPLQNFPKSGRPVYEGRSNVPNSAS